jgi:hypothetical protein
VANEKLASLQMELESIDKEIVVAEKEVRNILADLSSTLRSNLETNARYAAAQTRLVVVWH